MARPAGAFDGGQTAALNALKNRSLGPVAARVALARFAGAFEGGQMAGLNTLKNRCSWESCLGKAAELFEGGQTAGLSRRI